MPVIINGGKPVELLLVEDVMEEAELTMDTLREGRISNLRVHWVRDGEEAMAFLRREGSYSQSPRPNLVLLDLNLPKKDGREVLEELKRDTDLRRIPVIVLTTSAAQTDIMRAYELQANCFITKPLDLDDFFSVVRSIKDFWVESARLPSV